MSLKSGGRGYTVNHRVLKWKLPFSAYSSKAGHACDCSFEGIFVTYCDILYREN